MGRYKIGKGDILLVGCISRSHGGSDINNQNLIYIIKATISYSHAHLLLMGDFNYPNIVWNNLHALSSANSADHDCIDCIRKEGIPQHVTFPTRARVGHN